MPDIKTFSAQRIQAAFTLAVAIAFTLFISSTAFAQQQGERAIIAASSFCRPTGTSDMDPIWSLTAIFQLRGPKR